MMTPEQETELERQIECVVKRLRILAGKKMKGSLMVHFDGSGFLGKTFTENFTTCRDSFSAVKVGRQMEEEELVGALRKFDQ